MYFITGIHVAYGVIPEKYTDQRCFGFYSNLASATCAVETNKCDIFENYYKYMVVEDIGIGIHPTVVSEHWYMWDECIQKYVSTDRPSCVDNCCNFALG